MMIFHFEALKDISVCNKWRGKAEPYHDNVHRWLQSTSFLDNMKTESSCLENLLQTMPELESFQDKTRQDKTIQDIYYQNITSTISWHAVSRKTLVISLEINSNIRIRQRNVIVRGVYEIG